MLQIETRNTSGSLTPIFQVPVTGGKVNGHDVVFFFAKEARGNKIAIGDLVTAVVPGPQQIINWGL